MSERFEVILEICLKRLKAGETVMACLQDYPEYRKELENLLSAAASLYTIPQVSISEEFRHTSQARVMARIRYDSGTRTPNTIPLIDRLKRLDLRPLVPVALMTLVALVIWLTLPVAESPIISGTINASRFTLSILNGEAEILTPYSTSWHKVVDKTELSAGTSVRTLPDSDVVMTFFDGSTAKLESESEIKVIESNFPDQKSARIVLTQLSGTIWNHVIGTGEQHPYYAIQTQLATFVAQGTAFSTSVSATGTTDLTVTEGTVNVIGKQPAEEIRVTRDQQLHIAGNLTTASLTDIPKAKTELVLSAGPGGVSSVRDPGGASTGYLPNGLSFNQITSSKSTFSDGAQKIQIEEPKSGEYIISLRQVTPENTPLEIRLVKNGNVVFQNLLTLPATDGEGWTVRVNIDSKADAGQTGAVVSVEPLTGKSPESIVQTPLAVKRAVPINAAPVGETKTQTPTTAPPSNTTTTTGTTTPPEIKTVVPTTVPTVEPTRTTVPTSTTPDITNEPTTTEPTVVLTRTPAPTSSPTNITPTIVPEPTGVEPKPTDVKPTTTTTTATTSTPSPNVTNTTLK